MKKVLLAVLFLMLANPVFAETVAFGLTLGKTTESEAKKIYQLQLAGTNRHSRGNMYRVLNSNVMTDLKSLMLVFDGKGSLMAIQAVFPSNKQKEIFDSLRKKYKLAYNHTKLTDTDGPYLGPIRADRAGFDSGDTEIDMFTPNKKYGADTTLLYSHKRFVAMQADVEKEEEIQRKEQMDATL